MSGGRARCVVVTGAAGFVGANLVRRLVADGHDVHAVVRATTDPWRLAGVEDRVHLLSVDLADPDGTRDALVDVAPEWIFHLAARGAYSWQQDLREMIGTNLGGLVNLLDGAEAAGTRRIVCAGSSSEYGYKDHAPAETEWVDPNSRYAVTKAAATQLGRFVAQDSPVDVVTLRLYSAFGPYEEPNRLLPNVVVRGLRGELPQLVDPRTARDFVYAPDVDDAFLLAAEREASNDGAVYNVGSGTQTTIAELVDVTRRVLEVDAEPEYGSFDQRTWDTSCWVADPGRIRDELGWRPRHSLEDGFRAFVDWFRSDPGRVEHYERALGLESA